MLTLEEVKERLKHLDEIILLEVLDISSEELVEQFSDVIADKLEELIEELEEEEDE
jgi:hypothetical protein